MTDPLIATVFLIDQASPGLAELALVLRAAGLRALTFTSAAAFLEGPYGDAPGCVIAALTMPDSDGLTLQRELTRRASVLPLIFLAAHGDIGSGIAVMKGGARDCLVRPVAADILLAAVAAALLHNTAQRAVVGQRRTVRQNVARLTAREREVLALVTEGLLNKQVAARLGIAEKTVKLHRAKVMQKMNASSLAMLVRLADLAASN